MPKVGALEYIWCTMAKKSGLADRTKFHLPIEANDTSSIADISGNGYNGVLGGGDGSKRRNEICPQSEWWNGEPYSL